MRLTTKGRFAVTAMIDVAMYGTKGPVTLAGVSERQKISLSYLEQLFGKLRARTGSSTACAAPAAATASPGPPKRSRSPTSSLAVDEPIDATQCGGRENCKDDGQPLHDARAVGGLNAHIFSYLRSVSLRELVAPAGRARTAKSLSCRITGMDRRRPRRREPATEPI